MLLSEARDTRIETLPRFVAWKTTVAVPSGPVTPEFEDKVPAPLPPDRMLQLRLWPAARRFPSFKRAVRVVLPPVLKARDEAETPSLKTLPTLSGRSWYLLGFSAIEALTIMLPLPVG